MDVGAVPRRQVVLYIAFLGEAHGSSSGSVAYLNVARLERTLGAEGEKKNRDYWFKHTRTGTCVPGVPL